MTASLGATLSATLIWSAVPHPGVAPAIQPELTSGGKFAARAVQPAAYDGLDTMPLPRVASVPTAAVLASLEAAPPRLPRRAAGDEAAPAAPERRIAHPARAPVRAEARRMEPDSSAVPALAGTLLAVPPEPAPDVGLSHRALPSPLPISLSSSLASLPSLMPSIASGAREAWSVTASVGDALVAHIVPRMP